MKKLGSEASCTDGYMYEYRWGTESPDGIIRMRTFDASHHPFQHKQLERVMENVYRITAEKQEKENFVAHSTFVATRRVFDLVGLYQNVHINDYEDYLLLKQVVKKLGYITYIHQPLIRYDNRMRGIDSYNKHRSDANKKKDPQSKLGQSAHKQAIPILIVLVVLSKFLIR